MVKMEVYRRWLDLELGNCWVIRDRGEEIRRCVREWIKRGEDFRGREGFSGEFRDGLSFQKLVIF